MGSALAAALLDGGHPTTVWNRTPGKAEPLVARGATRAETVVDAVSAGTLAIVWVLDYAPAREVLAAAGVRATEFTSSLLIPWLEAMMRSLPELAAQIDGRALGAEDVGERRISAEQPGEPALPLVEVPHGDPAKATRMRTSRGLGAPAGVRARWSGPVGTSYFNGIPVTVIGIVPRDVAAPDPSSGLRLPPSRRRGQGGTGSVRSRIESL